MKLDTSEWRNFRVGTLFSLKAGKANQGMLSDGNDCFYIGAKRDDNGVMLHCKYDERLVQEGNCIVFICNGQGSVGYANYMDRPFIGTTDIVAGYNDNLTPLSGLFIATVSCLERPKYSFGRKWKTHLADTIIKLPQKEDGTPDWEFMESYMKTLHYKPLTTKNKPGKAPELETEKWAFFYIRDIFEITNCYPHDLGNLEEGDVPFIGRTASNNGLQGYVSVPDDETNAPGCISISRVATNIALWQDRPFATSQHITTLRSPHLNIHSGMFICGLLNHEMEGKFSYGRTIGQKDIDSMRLKLPVTSTGTPDWQFMEYYIKALPYGDRL